ncbi:hypothetical protein TrVE_jg11757 [Triparma verrucosa]|uniref:Uncharacterized protein n=1 Tax=Triparma verrucosa TaxID=1606542 RepID=A0A9W7CLN8_9STRA|nr:hypothetical protein TrVE_jg11757 [Triparma verrucosa]
MQNLLNRNLHQFNVIPFSSNGRELWKAYVKLNIKSAAPDFLLGVFTNEQQATNACFHNSPPVWADDSNSTCKLCSKTFGLVSRAHHCRNCGCVCCSECSPTFWPSKMVPATYHLSEKKVRICRACHTLMEQFRGSLLRGTNEDFDRAIACISTNNINLMSPYSIYSDCCYPVHCAAIGGNVNIFKYLVEEQGCALSFVRNGGVEPYRTKSAETCLSLAAGRGNITICRYLVVERGVSIKEVRSLRDLQALVDKLIRSTPSASTPPMGHAVIQEDEEEGEEEAVVEACWVEHFDEASGRPYYYNESTGATSWVPPPPGWEESGHDPTLAALAPPLDPHNRPSMDNEDDDDQCAVCMDKGVEGCFTPCGHMVCCVDCGEALDSCPICREACFFIKTFRN